MKDAPTQSDQTDIEVEALKTENLELKQILYVLARRENGLLKIHQHELAAVRPDHYLRFFKSEDGSQFRIQALEMKAEAGNA